VTTNRFAVGCGKALKRQDCRTQQVSRWHRPASSRGGGSVCGAHLEVKSQPTARRDLIGPALAAIAHESDIAPNQSLHSPNSMGVAVDRC